MPGDLTRRGVLGAAQAGFIAPTLLGAGAVAAQPGAFARKSNFDLGWKFLKGDAPGAEAPAFNDADWRGLDVPHDWSIEGPYDENAASGGSGGYAPTGIGWYRKRFALPAGAAGKHVSILFDGVYERSEVWINGARLGLRPNGYASFAYDLTPHLVGRDNVLAVRVDNSRQPNSRWYSGSGIYRHVWLIATDSVHLPLWGVFVRASGVSQESATIEVSARARNGGASAAACTLRAAIVDAGGASVATSDVHARVRAGAEHVFEHRLRLDAPALWSHLTPNMYALRTELFVDGTLRDTETIPFGVRDVRFDVDRGFLLNGERVKLNGVCLHADGGAVGMAVPERIWERRLALLKEMGCNSVRTSHHPFAPEFYDLCDRMGMMVMDEAFDEWRQPKNQTREHGYHAYFDEWWERDVSAMVERDRNHPSIVIWSAGNEVPDQTHPEGHVTLQGLLDVLHAKDPTRPVTVGCDNIAAEPRPATDAFLSRLDVVGYNYADRWRDRREKIYAVDRHAHPSWRFIGTESTALGGVRGVHPYDAESASPWGPAANRRVQVEQFQKFIQTYDYVSGDFIWTGIDYLGEAGWPNKLAASGAIDTCGFKKDAFYFYQSLWTRAPMLHITPHWNWAGREGQMRSVSCYTNCDTVELFLNGRSLGAKGYAFPRPGMIERWPVMPPRARELMSTADLHLAWDVPYAPGVLRAVGTIGGEQALVTEVRTTGAPAALRLSVDRDRIGLGRDDVAHVQVEVVDRNGLMVPDADNDIAFVLGGMGKLIGLDNGRPDDHESYQSERRKAFNGMALALLQSNGRAGEMVLSANAAGLRGAEIRVQAGGA